VDTMMRTAPPRVGQKKEMTAFRHLELEHVNLNVAVVHEIGETSLVAINDGSNSE
jgi:hypothetical protein